MYCTICTVNLHRVRIVQLASLSIAFSSKDNCKFTAEVIFKVEKITTITTNSVGTKYF